MSENIHITCSFCDRNKQDSEVLIAGANAHICNSCIEQAFHIVEQDSKSLSTEEKFSSNQFKLLKPVEINSKRFKTLAHIAKCVKTFGNVSTCISIE